MYQTSNKELFKKYLSPVFIETGTYYGDGVQAAIDAGFKMIYSIELSEELFNHCQNRFKDMINVQIIHGDSSLVLSGLLNTIKQPITFWLDGHWAGPGTARGEKESPLIEELEIIGKHYKIKSHTILIDDLRCWDINVQGFNPAMLIRKCIEINPEFRFAFEKGYIENDILVARP